MVLTTVSDRREHCTKTVGTKQRSSPHMCFVCEKGVRKNFKKKFTGKYLCQSRPATLLKKRLWHRCFLVIFAKILRIPPVAASGNRKFFIIFQLLASKF